MISKELLSEVLGNNTIENITVNHDVLRYEKYDKYVTFKKCSINIHELAHKCKEWAYHQKPKKRISSIRFSKKQYKCAIYMNAPKSIRIGDWYRADSEPEAIFKACEWIRLHIKERHDNN